MLNLIYKLLTFRDLYTIFNSKSLLKVLLDSIIL
jgi:hypothetical protein